MTSIHITHNRENDPYIKKKLFLPIYAYKHDYLTQFNVIFYNISYKRNC